jgi:hypothetical protein
MVRTGFILLTIGYSGGLAQAVGPTDRLPVLFRPSLPENGSRI